MSIRKRPGANKMPRGVLLWNAGMVRGGARSAISSLQIIPNVYAVGLLRQLLTTELGDEMEAQTIRVT
jgi:hypothetical protein